MDNIFYADWKKESSYSYTENHNLKLWAWEFVRRNPKYWAYWNETKEMYEAEQARRKKKGTSPHPMGLGLGRLLSHALLNYDPDANQDIVIFEKNIAADNPNHTQFSILRISADLAWGFTRIFPPTNDMPWFFQFGDELMTCDKSKSNDVFLTENEIIVKFNLTKKIDKQILQAQKQLLELQKEKSISPAGVKNKSKIWAQYLRILDANNSGIKRRESAPIIFPKVGENAEAQFSDALQRAKTIMNGEYRKWL